MKKLKTQLVLFFLLFGCIGLFANDENQSLLTKGNQLYNDGKYHEAIKTYETIIDHNFESAQLYYNLGNTHFKLKDLSSAILNYERAKKLDPNNKDILYNLGVANSRIVDKIEPVPQIIFKQWWNQFYNMFSANNWAFVAIILFIFTLVFTSIYLLSRQRHIKKLFFLFGLLFLILAGSSFFVSYQKYYYSINHKEAILFEPTITVKSSPNKNSVDLFVIHEGTKVYVIDKVGDWINVKIANGSIGWIKEGIIKYI